LKYALKTPGILLLFADGLVVVAIIMLLFGVVVG
jgi:hypothetical protein